MTRVITAIILVSLFAIGPAMAQETCVDGFKRTLGSSVPA
jgi:hypothetical protein